MSAEKTPAKIFKNKKTGVVWEVADPATLKRVLADTAAYEEIKPEQISPDILKTEAAAKVPKEKGPK